MSEMNLEKLQFHEGFNEALAHRIEAGRDVFLMPSLDEPCGLNQMYSLLRYASDLSSRGRPLKYGLGEGRIG